MILAMIRDAFDAGLDLTGLNRMACFPPPLFVCFLVLLSAAAIAVAAAVLTQATASSSACPLLWG